MSVLSKISILGRVWHLGNWRNLSTERLKKTATAFGTRRKPTLATTS
ncbi:MAG: hypothetical protein U1E21_22685 [Reyranellaceae bacterium]